MAGRGPRGRPGSRPARRGCRRRPRRRTSRRARGWRPARTTSRRSHAPPAPPPGRRSRRGARLRGSRRRRRRHAGRCGDHGPDSASGRLSLPNRDSGWTRLGPWSTPADVPAEHGAVPGVTVPLTVFEDRYRALVHHLLRSRTRRAPVRHGRHPGGLRVGDHGAQSLYRVGVRMQLTEVESNPDGTFEVVAVGQSGSSWTGSTRPGRSRSATSATGRTGDDRGGAGPRARPVAFTAYRAALVDIRSDPYAGTLPATRRGCRGPSPRSRRCPCLRPGPARGRGRRRAPGHGDRPAALGAAGDERHPSSLPPRSRADPVVTELTPWRGRSRAAAPRHRGPHPGRHRLHAARVRARPARRVHLRSATALGLDPACVFRP